MKAIKNKDISFVRKTLSPNVQYSLGGDSGNAIEGFLDHYHLKSGGRKTQFWQELATAVQLGCTKSKDEFECPYVFSKWPRERDGFEYIAVIKKDAKIRAKPHVNAPLISSVSYELLKLSDEKSESDWHVIDLGSQKVGYLAKADGRSPTDYRARFKRTSSAWKLELFVAGD